MVSLGIFHTCKWSNGRPITGFGRGFGGLQFDKSWQNLIRYFCIFFSGNYQLFLDIFLIIYATKEVCMFFSALKSTNKNYRDQYKSKGPREFSGVHDYFQSQNVFELKTYINIYIYIHI